MVKRTISGFLLNDPISSVSVDIDVSANEFERRNNLGQYGYYEVTPADCGIYPNVDRPNLGSLTIQPGGFYENLTIMASNLSLQANTGIDSPKAILKNVDIVGTDPGPTTGTSLVKAWGANHHWLELWDCRLRPQKPTMAYNAIAGHSFRAYRCEITGTVDGFSTYDTNRKTSTDVMAEAYGCWVHDLAYWPNPPDTSHSDGSHPDCWQVEGGGIIAIGNKFDGFVGAQYAPTMKGGNQSNAVFMIKPDVGLIGNLQIERNDIDGGAYSVNFAHDAPDRMLSLVGSVSFNRFGRNQRVNGTTISMPAAVTGTFEGNVYKDTGLPITVKHNG